MLGKLIQLESGTCTCTFRYVYCIYRVEYIGNQTILNQMKRRGNKWKEFYSDLRLDFPS